MSIVEHSGRAWQKSLEKTARRLNRLSLGTRPVLEELEKRYLLSAPPLPVIPSGAGTNFLVTSSPYNAVGDGTTNNTTAIQNAINACNAAGGGTVEVPVAAGAFECGAISMKSNVNLQIDSGAELQALSGLGGSVWINVNACTNWEITGLGSGASMGTLDGNSGGGIGSLNMIKINDSTIGLIQNLNINNSPHEHIQCGSGVVNNMTINGVDIDTSATAANTDGIDPAGLNWLIENCTISDGDDDIAVKPQNQPCANIDIENCTILAGHGISVGGETNAGLNNMTVNNVTFNGTTNGLRLKADRGNGGLVENVSYSNITMTNVQYPILIDSYYNQSNDFPTNPYSDTGSPVNSLTPIWQNITFANITSTDLQSGSLAAAIYGIPEAPVTNVAFENVNITALTGMQIDHVRNMSFDSNSHITVSSGPDLEGTNVPATYPVPVDSQIVAANYTNLDIGTPTVPFDTSESLYDPDTGNWTIEGDGANISGTSDQYNYTYQSITGDSSVAAQLTSLTGPGGSAVPQAGVMYRASTNAGDPFAAVVQTTAGQIVFEYRTSSGGTVQTSSPVSVPVATAYVKVVRVGNNFSGYYSTNGGTTYTQIGSTVALTGMSAAANAGLAVTADDNGATAAATFSHLSVAQLPSAQLAYAVQPSNVTAGVANSPSIVVDVDNAGGDINTSDNSNVTLSVASGPGTLSGTLTVAAVNGVATFNNVILDAAGAYTLTAADGSLTAATSTSFTVSAAAASKLAYSQQPSSASVNTAITPAITVDVEDQFGNVVTTDSSNVTLTKASGPGTLSGTLTVAAASGVATFSNAKLDTIGTYTLTASDGSLTTATSSSFSVNSVPAAKLAFAQQPTNVTAGSAISPAITVDVEDSNGNIVTTDTSNVTLAIATGPGAISGTVTVAAVSGVATFNNVILDTVGAYTLRATDSSLTAAVSSSFNVAIAAASKLVFEQQPTSTTNGVAISPAITVEVEDPYGNLETSNTSNVTLATATGPGALSGTTTVAAVGGVATFSDVTAASLGSYTIQASDGSLSTATSSSFNITALPGMKLAFSQQPTNATAGVTISPSVVVDVENVNSGVAISDSSNVTLSIATGSGTLLGTTTVAAVNGVATFSNLSIDTAGAYTLRATDGSLTSATSSAFNIAAAAATKVVFDQQPTGTTNGNPISPAITVEVEDAFGNVETSDTSTVTLATASGPGALSGTTSVAAVAGVATFSDVTIAAIGTYTIQATDGSLTSATSNSFNITSLPGVKLAFTQQPTNTTAGSDISPAVVVDVDNVNNGVAISDSSNVTLAIETGPGTLLGTATVAAVNGVATFSNLAIDTAGAYTLEATDGSLTAATSASFNVTPAAASKLAYSQQPSNAIINTVDTPAITVHVEDQFGNVVTTDTSNVTLATATGPGALSGTTTVAAVSGVATFSDITAGAVGTYTAQATDGSLTSATSSSFNIAYAVATKLVMNQQPTDITAGNTISPAITVNAEDNNANLAIADTSSVTLSIATGTGTLIGTTTAPVENGVATFSDLSLDKAGTYTLAATDGSLVPTATSSFTVAPGATSQLVIANQQFVAGEYGPVSLETILALEDQYGNVATGDNSQVTLSGGVNGQLTAQAVDGIAQFHGITTSQLGTYQLNFSDGGLSTHSTTTFKIMRIPLKWRDWFNWVSLPTVTTTAEAQNEAESEAPVSGTPDIEAAPDFIPAAANRQQDSGDSANIPAQVGDATNALDTDAKVLGN
jgi:polygalacturonase